MYNKTLLEIAILILLVCGFAGFISMLIYEFRHIVKNLFKKIYRKINNYVEYTRKI